METKQKLRNQQANNSKKKKKTLHYLPKSISDLAYCLKNWFLNWKIFSYVGTNDISTPQVVTCRLTSHP